MKQITNPIKIIRLKCLDCSNNSSDEVKFCPVTQCVLYPFRFGKNPFRIKQKRELTDEQRKVISDRFKKSKILRQTTHENKE
jgi:hypothetical protein